MEVKVFGQPMSFWAQNMPMGMFLRSNWTATRIADPNLALTLEAYQSASGTKFDKPVPVHDFIQYGLWYQREAVPNLDRRNVSLLESRPEGFRLTFEDGKTVTSRRVIVAAGIGPFARRPDEFQHLPSSLVSHTSEHRDLREFAGRQVLVIGSGQSALESAALLHENAIEVEVAARASRIQWLQGFASRTLHHQMGRLTSRLLYAPTDVGPAGLSQLMARPHLLRHLPRALQNKLWKRAIRPAGARWLVKRLHDVPIHLGRRVVSAAPLGRRVKVTFDDASERTIDHILLGTGYRVDISKYAFLAPKLVKTIDSVNGYPLLNESFETSVPRLHILGAPAAWSFGPLMQFVSGTQYASEELVRSIIAQRQKSHA
jgi:cation diffusion facilitator CzcD-associated flavoprotein CzcO